MLDQQESTTCKAIIECAWEALQTEVKTFMNKEGFGCVQEPLCPNVKEIQPFAKLVKNGKRNETVVGLLTSLFVCSKEFALYSLLILRMRFIGEMSMDAFPNTIHAFSSWIELCVCDAMTVSPTITVDS